MILGGIVLSASGYIQVHAYTSNARIPLQGTAVTITGTDGTGIAMRLTNRNGTLDTPVEITVPDLSASQTPNTGIVPFASVNLYARLENFEPIEIENLQVFAGTVTLQPLQLIPLAEFPGKWNKAESFQTQSQNL